MTFVLIRWDSTRVLSTCTRLLAHSRSHECRGAVISGRQTDGWIDSSNRVRLVSVVSASLPLARSQDPCEGIVYLQHRRLRFHFLSTPQLRDYPTSVLPVPITSHISRSKERKRVRKTAVLATVDAATITQGDNYLFCRVARSRHTLVTVFKARFTTAVPILGPAKLAAIIRKPRARVTHGVYRGWPGTERPDGAPVRAPPLSLSSKPPPTPTTMDFLSSPHLRISSSSRFLGEEGGARHRSRFCPMSADRNFRRINHVRNFFKDIPL